MILHLWPGRFHLSFLVFSLWTQFSGLGWFHLFVVWLCRSGHPCFVFGLRDWEEWDGCLFQIISNCCLWGPCASLPMPYLFPGHVAQNEFGKATRTDKAAGAPWQYWERQASVSRRKSHRRKEEHRGRLQGHLFAPESQQKRRKKKHQRGPVAICLQATGLWSWLARGPCLAVHLCLLRPPLADCEVRRGGGSMGPWHWGPLRGTRAARGEVSSALPSSNAMGERTSKKQGETAWARDELVRHFFRDEVVPDIVELSHPPVSLNSRMRWNPTLSLSCPQTKTLSSMLD
jgi:hypothetical protein